MSREQRMVITIAEIIQELLQAVNENKDVNLNRLKTQIASKYGLETSPRLVDIIAAVPAESKKILYPKLKSKPIRTASGVSTELFLVLSVRTWLFVTLSLHQNARFSALIATMKTLTPPAILSRTYSYWQVSRVACLSLDLLAYRPIQNTNIKYKQLYF